MDATARLRRMCEAYERTAQGDIHTDISMEFREDIGVEVLEVV